MQQTDYARVTTYACAAVAGGVGVLVMIGWMIQSRQLVQLHPHFAPMQFNTALFFVLCAASLALTRTRLRWIAALPAMFAAIGGFVTLLQYLTNTNFGIDTLFIEPFTVVNTSHAGRMAINTSLGFVVCGAVLAFCAANRTVGSIQALGITLLGSAVGTGALLALTGELTGIDTGNLWGHTVHPAVRSATCFLFLSVAIIMIGKDRSVGAPHWLPIPIFLGIAALTLSVVQAVRVEQDTRLLQSLTTEARHAAREIERHLGHVYKGLDRLAQRWEVQGGTPRELWNRDAAAYVQDFPALLDLAWMDPSGRVQWSSPAGPAVSLHGFDLTAAPHIAATLNWASGAKIPRATAVINDEPGAVRGSFLRIRPLFVNGRYDGAIVAQIDVSLLFNHLLANTALDRLWVRVTENGAPIFSNSAGALPDDKFQESVLLTNLGRVWLLFAAPKPSLVELSNPSDLAVITAVGLIIAVLIAFCVRLAVRRQSDHDILRISEERLALAVSGTHDGLWDWNVVTDRLYYSPRLLAMLGYEPAHLDPSAAAFIEMMHPDDRDAFIASIQDHFARRAPFHATLRVPHRDGHEVWLNSRGQAVWNADGKATRMTGFMSDISHEKEVERLKNEFVSTVSHELRTPLTSIRGALALIRGNVLGALPARAQEMADIAHKNCERLILLINDILDLDKIESGQTRFDIGEEQINKLLHDDVEANRSFAVKDGIRLVFEPLEPDAVVKVDPNRLNQVLNNLISNAAKFSPQNDVVTISTVRRDGAVRVCVSDHGPGIPEEFRARIFNRFAQADSSPTRHQAGTGLGLHISQQIVKRFGGEIGFDTVPGQGTVFWFELPEYVRTEKTVDAKVTPLAARDGAPILICEDDIDAATVLQAQLLHEGFRSVVVHTLARARQRLAEAPFQALILDLYLPDGNGIDLIRAIRSGENGVPLPIIVTSMRAEEGRKALNGGAIGVVDWLKKEIDPVELMTALRRYASASRGAKPRILHVEDDADFRQVIAQILGDSATIVQAGTVEEGIGLLTTQRFDLMILDLTLSDGSGLALLERLGSFQSKLPVLILSAQETDERVRGQVVASLVKSRISEGKLAEMIAQLIGKPAKSGREAA